MSDGKRPKRVIRTNRSENSTQHVGNRFDELRAAADEISDLEDVSISSNSDKPQAEPSKEIPNPDQRLDSNEGLNSGKRLNSDEDLGSDKRLDLNEGLDPDRRLDSKSESDQSSDQNLNQKPGQSSDQNLSQKPGQNPDQGPDRKPNQGSNQESKLKPPNGPTTKKVQWSENQVIPINIVSPIQTTTATETSQPKPLVIGVAIDYSGQGPLDLESQETLEARKRKSELLSKELAYIFTAILIVVLFIVILAIAVSISNNREVRIF